MKTRRFEIGEIPAMQWGEESKSLFIAVHGNMSCKDDTVIRLFAEEAVRKDYSVLSFDLPEHGDRIDKDHNCSVQNCVKDLTTIYDYAQSVGNPIGVFGCSMGTYFSLLSYSDKPIEKCLFLSPVVDMERIIKNMMKWFEISEEMLRAEKEIETPIGQTLYWDYYHYVTSNPIGKWNKSTKILYGSNDNMCEFDTIKDFIFRNNCTLDVMESGEHDFHTVDQLEFYQEWLRRSI